MAWVPDRADTHYLGEFGIVFLMFSIGLEFSLPQLRAMRRAVFGLGMLQVTLTTAAARWCWRSSASNGRSGWCWAARWR